MNNKNNHSGIGAKEDTWNNVAEKYSLEISDVENALSSEITKIFNRCGVSHGSKLLEVGCGSGHLSLLLNLKGYKTDLLDFADKALLHAENIFRKYNGSDDASFYRLDALAFNSEDVAEYDVAWNSGVCEHFSADSLVKMLHNMAAVSNNVLIIVPNPMSVFYIAGKRRMLNDGGWSYGTELQRDNYEKAFNAANLKIIQHGYIGKDMTANWISNCISGESESLFQSLLKEGQIPVNEYYLQFFLAQKNGPNVKILQIDDEPTIDKTFYLDAMGTATALISTLRYQNWHQQLQLEAQKSMGVSLDALQEEYKNIISEKERVIAAQREVIEKMESLLAGRD